MKQETADAYEEVSEEGHDKDGVVAMFPAAHNACVGKVYEKKVGQSVNYLCRVRSRVVVLEDISMGLRLRSEECKPLRTSSASKSPEPNSLRSKNHRERKEARNTCCQRSDGDFELTAVTMLYNVDLHLISSFAGCGIGGGEVFLTIIHTYHTYLYGPGCLRYLIIDMIGKVSYRVAARVL